MGNSRSRSQIDRSWCVMSSSACVVGTRRPSGSRLAMRCPRTRYMFTSEWTCTTFSLSDAGSANAPRSVHPPRGLVRHREAREHVVVEAVVAEQQAVDAAEELAALRAGDDPVVVGVGERGDLAHPDFGERVRIGALELGGVADAAHAEDEALSGHEPRYRVHGADHPGVRDRARGAGEVVGRHLARAHLLDERFVRAPEPGEVHRVGALDARHEERVGAVAPLHVDGQPEVHLRVAHDRGLAVDRFVRRVEVREVGERAHHRERDEVREADLAGERALELVVEDLAVDLEQLRRHRPHRRGGGDGEARLHVLDRAGGAATQRLGLLALEHHRPGRRLRWCRRRASARLRAGTGSGLLGTVAAVDDGCPEK